MEFELDKCAKGLFVKGKLQAKQKMEIDDKTSVKVLDQMYIGIDQTGRIVPKTKVQVLKTDQMLRRK